jgi:hypothetical protein
MDLSVKSIPAMDHKRRRITGRRKEKIKKERNKAV